MKPTFFKSRAEFRQWLERHAKTKQELLVGFCIADSSKPSITWPESVEETRLKRLKELIKLCAAGEKVPLLRKPTSETVLAISAQSVSRRVHIWAETP